MKNILFLLFFSATSAFAQNIYSKAFGNPKAEPIVFLHGGPGYNCANFEATTAQILADNGYYVIVYDRRGEGRSKDIKAEFTFNQTFSDLNDICKKYKIKTANLMGHSFGGMVATLFAKAYPKKVKSVILVGAPICLQESFRTIIRSSRTIYQNRKDSLNLAYLDLLEKMDTNSMQYASFCFMNAMKNGFYSPKEMTDDAKKIYSKLESSELFVYTKEMTQLAPQGFSDNDKYTTINLTNDIKDLLKQGTKVYGLYGKEDGLYSANQITALQNIIGESQLKYFDQCSHNVFIHQQQMFIDAINDWYK